MRVGGLACRGASIRAHAAGGDLGDRIQAGGAQRRDVRAVSGSGDATEACTSLPRAYRARASSSGRLPRTMSATRGARWSEGGRLRQRERLRDDRVRQVACQRSEQDDRHRGGHVRDPCRSRPESYGDAGRCDENEARCVDAAAEKTGRRPPASERGAELGGRARVSDETEGRHLAREERRVTGGRAVGDDRTPAREGFETRDAAGRVHEHVRGGEKVAHGSVNPRTVTRGSRRTHASSCARPPRRDRRGRPPTRPSSSRAASTAPSRSPTPQPPPETTTIVPVRRQAEGPACLGWRPRRRNSARDERRDGRRAATAGDPLHRRPRGARA